MFYVHLNHHLNLVSPRNQLRRLERSPKASSRHGRKVARRENLKITTLTLKIGQTFATTTPYTFDLIWFRSLFRVLSFFTKFGRCVDFLPKQRISIRGGCLTLFWLPSIQSYFSDETCLPNSAFSVLSSWNFYQKRRNACSLLCE